MMEEKKLDDGSLNFLKIERNKDCREFNCRVITQQELVNREFYLVDFLRDVQTKNELELELKHNYQIFPTQKRGIDFVGYVFFQDHILIRKSIKQNFCRKVTKLQKRKLNNKEFKQGIAGWLGWCKYSNSINLLKKNNI